MAILEQLGSGVRCVLRSRHLVGRSHMAHLCLDQPTVSSEHAVLCWTGRTWEVRDLGSRNGTAVDGRRLTAGQRYPLARGAVLGFGSEDHGWRLIDDAPPAVMALGPDGGAPRCARGDLLALPADQEPEVLIYRDRTGEWVADREGEVQRVRDGAHIAAGGLLFTLHIPDIPVSTWSRDTAPPRLQSVELRFSVSYDEEYVALTAIHGSRTIDLGARAHHYLLLTLARARLGNDTNALEDVNDGGWVYQDDLADMLGVDDKHINLLVFRCRQQMADAGIAGAAAIVERRKPTRQMRLGVQRVSIAQT